MGPNNANASVRQSSGRKLKICVLQASHEGLAGYEDEAYCTPELYDKEGTYQWSSAYIKKETSEAQVRELAAQGFDVFLNLCDGAHDEGHAGVDVIDALEKFGCAYTGADQELYEPSKVDMKRVLQAAGGVDVPPWALIQEVDMEDDARALQQVQEATRGLSFPLIVKHYKGYSSIGMDRFCKVQDHAQLVTQVRKFVTECTGALVEQFITGREFTVLVAENNAEDAGSPVVYVPAECCFGNGEDFKHYDLKWHDCDNFRLATLGEAEADLNERLKEVTRRAFVALGAQSYGRCDFRVDDKGTIYFLEINANCGMFYPPDSVPGSADFILTQDPATNHQAFIAHIVTVALARQAAKQTARGS